MLRGTVQTVTDDGMWMLMDEWFNPTSMSGSPVMSEYTGKVVGCCMLARCVASSFCWV